MKTPSKLLAAYMAGDPLTQLLFQEVMGLQLCAADRSFP